MRIDIDRLVSRIEALGEIGAVSGPDGERGCARLALTDADRDGPRPGHDLDARPRARRHHRRDRQRGRHASRERSRRCAPVMTGSHIDTVRTGGRFDGNLGVLAGLEVLETLITLDITTERGVVGGVLHRRGGRPLRARHARQPGVRGRDGARGGARRHGRRRRSATRRRAGAHRLCRADAVPGGGVPALLRRAAHRAGTDPGGRRHRDRRRRRRAGDLVDRAHDHRSVGACRHDTDAHAPRSWARRRTRDRASCATSPPSSAATRWRRWAGSSSSRTWSTSFRRR